MSDITRELYEIIGKLKILIPEIEGYKINILSLERSIAKLEERIENHRKDIDLAHNRISALKDAIGSKWWDIIKIVLGSSIGALITFLVMSLQ